VVRTVLGVAFIATIGVGAVIGWCAPTVARGDALVDLFFEAHPGRAITCDDHVPITAAGMAFRCRAVGDDGRARVFAITIDRDGAVTEAPVP